MPMFLNVMSTLKCSMTIFFYVFYFSHLSYLLLKPYFPNFHLLKMSGVEGVMFKASL